MGYPPHIKAVHKSQQEYVNVDGIQRLLSVNYRIGDSQYRKQMDVGQEFKQYFPKSGWVEHNPKEIWSSILSVIAKVLSENNLNELIQKEKLSVLSEKLF